MPLVVYGCDTNLIIEAVPEKQQGVAAGTLVLAEGLGTSLGTAILAPILAAHPYQATALAEDGSRTTFDIPQVYTDTGWTLGFVVSAAIAAVCVVLVFLMRAGRTPPPAEHTHHRGCPGVLITRAVDAGRSWSRRRPPMWLSCPGLHPSEVFASTVTPG
ncbi:hypothetical protein ACU686_16225 [Yinghuangia aomiensis]